MLYYQNLNDHQLKYAHIFCINSKLRLYLEIKQLMKINVITAIYNNINNN